MSTLFTLWALELIFLFAIIPKHSWSNAPRSPNMQVEIKNDRNSVSNNNIHSYSNRTKANILQFNSKAIGCTRTWDLPFTVQCKVIATAGPPSLSRRRLHTNLAITGSFASPRKYSDWVFNISVCHTISVHYDQRIRSAIILPTPFKMMYLLRRGICLYASTYHVTINVVGFFNEEFIEEFLQNRCYVVLRIE